MFWKLKGTKLIVTERGNNKKWPFYTIWGVIPGSRKTFECKVEKKGHGAKAHDTLARPEPRNKPDPFLTRQGELVRKGRGGRKS